MGVIAVAMAAVVIETLLLVAMAGWLCRSVLRHGGDYEAEMRALSVAFHVRAPHSDEARVKHARANKKFAPGRPASM